MSHTVTSANSLSLVMAMPVGTLFAGSLTVVGVLAVFEPAVPITPFW